MIINKIFSSYAGFEKVTHQICIRSRIQEFYSDRRHKNEHFVL